MWASDYLMTVKRLYVLLNKTPLRLPSISNKYVNFINTIRTFWFLWAERICDILTYPIIYPDHWQTHVDWILLYNVFGKGNIACQRENDGSIVGLGKCHTIVSSWSKVNNHIVSYKQNINNWKHLIYFLRPCVANGEIIYKLLI